MSKSAKKRDIQDELDDILGQGDGNRSGVEKKKSKSSSSKILKMDGSKKKRPLSPYFYKVSNHHELFKIGNSYYEDFSNGVKSFAISSTGYQSSQQRSILGLASFFDHQEEIKIAIVSDNLFLGAFKEIISACRPEELELNGIDFPIEIHSFYNHFDFIDLNTLIDCGKDEDCDYEEMLDDLIDMYDVIFWDVPELYKIQSDKELYFPVIMRFDSLSVIVAKTATSTEEIDEIKTFFMGYGINLKGLLLDPQNKKKGGFF